jgi:hypothetical protein
MSSDTSAVAAVARKQGQVQTSIRDPHSKQYRSSWLGSALPAPLVSSDTSPCFPLVVLTDPLHQSRSGLVVVSLLAAIRFPLLLAPIVHVGIIPILYLIQARRARSAGLRVSVPTGKRCRAGFIVVITSHDRVGLWTSPHGMLMRSNTRSTMGSDSIAFLTLLVFTSVTSIWPGGSPAFFSCS